jgi:hypothetical protein
MAQSKNQDNDRIQEIGKQPEIQAVIDALRGLKTITDKQSIQNDQTEAVEKSDNDENSDGEDNKKSGYTKKVSGDGMISYIDESGKEFSEIPVNISLKEGSESTKNYNPDKNQNNQTVSTTENYDDSKTNLDLEKESSNKEPKLEEKKDLDHQDKNHELSDPRFLPKLGNDNEGSSR